MAHLRLVHDVLDAQLVDRQKVKIGRVDALTLELDDARPPRVSAICIGGPERAHRAGRWMVWISRAMRAVARVKEPGVSRVPFGAVRTIGDTIQLDVDADELASGRLERWLDDHVIGRIPGAARKKQ